MSRRGHAGRPRLFNEQGEARIRERYAAGESIAALATEYGCSPPTIRTIINGDRPRPKTWLSDEQRAEICMRYEDGESMASLAADFNISQPTVRNILLRAGVSTERRAMLGEASAQAVLTEDDVVEMRKRYANGETFAAIAADYDLTTEAIRKAVTGMSWSHVPGAVPARGKGPQKSLA